MKKSTFLRQALTSTVIAGLAVTAAPALAQDISEDGANNVESEGDVIIVTGSRLNVNPNLQGANPVLSVTDAEIDARGTTRIEDLTNQLPQVFAGQAGEVSNGSSGTATLNLRGLGAVRTLVLIDGKRLPYGSSQISAPNLDLVPTQLVERVDILTGGASAVYGSDAVAGVANFILKDDFEGIELDLQGGFAQHGNDLPFFENVLQAGAIATPGSSIDGEEFSASIIMGANTADDRGNVTLYGTYENRSAITQDNRAFSACAIGGASGPFSFEGAGCAGSLNFRGFGSTVTGEFGFQELDGTIVPLDLDGPPNQTYNFGPRNFFQRPSERWQLGARGHYDISDNVTAFVDVGYTSNVSDAQIAETASFGFGAYSINCDNPFLAGNPGISFYDIFGCTAADIAAGNDVSGVFASHRNVEGGPRNSRLENDAFRIVAGLRGDIWDAWSYELFGQYAETNDTAISTNDFIVANVQQAFFAVDDGTGNVVCRDPSGGCVPYNIFQRNPDGTTRVTPEQYNYLQGVGVVVGSTNQKVVGANIQGDLGEYGFSSPFSEEGIGLLVGLEYREDTLDAIPDEISQVPGGGFTGVGGATLPVAGQVQVFELYSELQIPLITDRPFFQELTLSGQYRYSDYTATGNDTENSFSTDAYGVSLSWVPVDDIKLRGQYQRSVRAPNVIELYTGQDVGLPNLNEVNGSFDPCATATPRASAAACANTGVTAAQYGNIPDVISGQTQGIFGGNPLLDPESSDTWTFGAVLTPSFAPGLSISVDWFDITVEDYISAGIGAQTALDNCLATGDAAFCDLITRDGAGSLNSGTPGVGFLLTNINIAEVNTQGIDGQVRWSTGIGGLGDLIFDYAGTYLLENDFVPFPGADAIDCEGRLNNDCIAPVNPTYRHRALVTWQTPVGLDATFTWRHFSGTKENDEGASPNIDDRFPSIDYLDVSFRYGLTDNIDLRAGVLNVLNQNPPVSSSSGPPFGNGNTYPTIYDTGRQFFAGARIKL